MLVVYGAHGVDYVGRGEVVGGCWFSGAGGAAVESAAFAQEGGARGGVDGAVLEERGVLAGFLYVWSRLGGGSAGNGGVGWWVDLRRHLRPAEMCLRH